MVGFGAKLLAREPLSTIAGVAAPKCYRNRYLGFEAKFLKLLFQTLVFFEGKNAVEVGILVVGVYLKSHIA